MQVVLRKIYFYFSRFSHICHTQVFLTASTTPNSHQTETADLVTFAKEILNGKIIFCAVPIQGLVMVSLIPIRTLCW